MARMQANERFQGLCLVSDRDAGVKYISICDTLPKAVRERLHNSPFNLCAACLEDIARRMANPHGTPYVNLPNIEEYMQTIDIMEQQVREMN
jgi:hypothetical protein